MKCENIANNMILIAIILAIVGDSLGLIAELLNRKSAKKAAQEQNRKETELNQTLENLTHRLSILEKQMNMLDKSS
ncbi:hypothetical protein [Anaerosinus massiliensis]|uniref:hypothetical protein n=1 Tax=Massilibacillus massiliensis TaxID=1806837 RepID=UPI000DA61299|nr:hypothetical protein [Massilibacillus massiliensis]